jgi:hypothetical protein
MQGFRNYNLETMQREHCLDLMAPSYGKSISPPLSPNSGKSQRKNRREMKSKSLKFLPENFKVLFFLHRKFDVCPDSDSNSVL